MKKFMTLILAGVGSLAVCLSGCGTDGTDPDSTDGGSNFKKDSEISVVSREEGSGTRDAFTELTGVLVKDDEGNKSDNTTAEAIIIDGTQGVMSNVAGDPYAIGYISMGSLNETIKAVKVGGVEATAANVKNETYKLSRPFNIVNKSGLSEVAQDFVKFILSKEGQQVINDNGYISVVENAESYDAASKPEGKVAVAGSSSVSPVMEKLKEAYEAINTNAKIEIQTTDSSAGITAAKEGTCDIGMASRAVKDSEIGEGADALTSTVIAMDGIAVIVNNNNVCEDLTMDQIKNIFTGEAVTWSDVLE